MKNETFKELFYDTDSILIIDTNGKVMYYENYNDNINMLKSENVIGRSIFEMYPFFKREDFTVFRAMDARKPILNEFQSFQVLGVNKSAMNSAFPLANDSGVVGCIVISVELPRPHSKMKKNKLTAKYGFQDIITQNEVFKNRLEILKKVSENDSNVLIYGETGTGKELIAHAIHNRSKRRKRPFMIQNCAAIPSSIMESILFGTAKGSFTGSLDKAGLFEAVDGGTIFLDEINSMPLDLQSKVLRAIENKSIKRIGENIEREIDLRIIASTNEDLSLKVAQGAFRADLYYRLNVVSFTIPPLRERRDDIQLLTNHLIGQYNQLLNKNISGISNEVFHIFFTYEWRGNVRELKNVLEYALNLKDDGIILRENLPLYMQELALKSVPEDLPQLSRDTSSPDILFSEGSTLSGEIELYEKRIIKKVYENCRYNVLKTAKTLGIPRQTLYYKLKKYGL